MALDPEFQAHLATGATSVCRCWSVRRRDGMVFGFTDHDRALAFDGLTFKADTGLTARAVQQTTGLAIDNSEALGVLSDLAITEDDIRAGRFDGAEVMSWLVNWADLSQRLLQFRGTIGEIERVSGAFQAELRGLTEALNQPQGRVYQKPCSAVLGDGSCRFDLTVPGYAADLSVETIDDGKFLRFSGLSGFGDRWFERGRMIVQGGAAAGLVGIIKNDRLDEGTRIVELWEAVAAPLVAGDAIRLEPGCDKTAVTCQQKFNNFMNFRGFPHVPGEDWLMSYPRSGAANTGGSLNR